MGIIGNVGHIGNNRAKSVPKVGFLRRAAWAPLNARVSPKRARWFQGHPNEGKAARSAAAAANQIAVRIHRTRTPGSLRGQLASRGALLEPPSPCAAGRCVREAPNRARLAPSTGPSNTMSTGPSNTMSTYRRTSRWTLCWTFRWTEGGIFPRAFCLAPRVPPELPGGDT